MSADKPAAGYNESEHEKAEHYRQALRNSPIVFARVDTALRYEWIFNPHPDFDPTAVIGKRDDELDSGPGIDAMVALKRRTLAEGVQLRQEITFERSDGLHTYDITATPIADAAGQFTHLITASIDITDRVRAEAALRESEVRYRTLFEENQSIMFLVDTENGAVVDANPAAAAYYGLTRADLCTLHLTDVVSMTVAEIRAEFQRAAAEQRNYVVLQHRHTDGTLREIEVFVSYASLGGRSLAYAIVHDVTQRKQAEEALMRSEAALKRSQAVAHVGHWTWDIRSNRITWSDEMKRLIGLDPNECGGDLDQMIDRVIHKDDREHMRALSRTVTKELQPVDTEFRVVWPDGSVHYARAIPGESVLDAHGNVIQLSGVVQDITERKLQDLERDRLLHELQDKAEQLAQVMRSVPEGVLLLDNLNHVLLANPRAEQMLARLAGYDASYAAAPGGEQRLLQLGGTSLEGLLTTPPLGQWHTVQEGRLTFELIARPVEAGPVPAGWVLVLRDVTAERVVQEQLQRQERLAAVGQLAAGIAHDFNNIMSTISIYAELTSETPGLTAKDRARTETIVEQAQRATRMIRQILDFTRQSVFERQALDLLPLLKEEEKLLKQTLPENIAIELSAPGGEYFVNADPTRMQQLVMNLAVNARDAMPDGGRLHIQLARLQFDTRSKAPLPGMEPGDWVQLQVGDTGNGIAPAHMPQIFEPFFTTKEPGKGTGLGLAQVHGIVAQHEGHITIASEVGVGTVFTIYLPAQVAAARAGAAVTSHLPMPHGHGELVLVVEDDAALRTSLVELIEMWNYKAAQAANGEEALDFLAQHGEPVAVIVSDVVMPRLGGIGLVRALRSAGGATPVILMSGHMPDEDRLGLKDAGVVAWLDKPPSSWLLAKAIAEALPQG